MEVTIFSSPNTVLVQILLLKSKWKMVMTKSKGKMALTTMRMVTSEPLVLTLATILLLLTPRLDPILDIKEDLTRHSVRQAKAMLLPMVTMPLPLVLASIATNADAKDAETTSLVTVSTAPVTVSWASVRRSMIAGHPV